MVRRRRRIRPRPSRVFHLNHRLVALRRAIPPLILGRLDWLLYRHPHCPWKAHYHQAKAYRTGYAACKTHCPRPPWKPIR